MATIPISQAEAERDLHGLLARLDENTSFLIENDSQPVAMLQAARPGKLTVDASFARLEQEGSHAVMDADFARDVELGIEKNREPLDRTLWD